VLASVPFTATANTFYWMRLDVAAGTSDIIRAKIWANGSAEPRWMVTATDTSPLAANLVGTGGSWDLAGAGESIAYTCYTFAANGLAVPCGQSPMPTSTATSAATATATPTRAPTATPTPAPTLGTIQTYPLTGGVGDPWGTAVDSAGNVWFAEPGCDFAPTCPSGSPPGQLGELLAGSHTLRFYTLPNISGNQPIFVALDSSGNVWFTTPNNSMIGEFNPTTQTFLQWPVTPGSGPWDLTFDQNGKLWYTEHFVSAVGEFDPSTHLSTDFTTPTNNTNPYGIAASGSLVWFTENNSSVARIAKLDTSANDQISEYLIRQQLPGGLTPHMIGVGANGHPWWTEGWVRNIGTLDPSVATPGQCGTVSSWGDCTGVTEFPLPPPPSTCHSSHVSGLAVQGGSSLIWLDDSLAGQVGAYNPATNQFALDNLSCGVHPHDGLEQDSALRVWWDEEFNNALGELTP
jgi:streptogramin lyase